MLLSLITTITNKCALSEQIVLGMMLPTLITLLKATTSVIVTLT